MSQSQDFEEVLRSKNGQNLAKNLLSIRNTNIVSVIDALYEAISSDAALLALPAKIAETCAARSCVLSWRDPSGWTEIIAASHFKPSQLIDYAALDHENPWSAVMLAHPDQAILAGRLVAAKTLRKSRFHQIVLAKHHDDTIDCLGLAFESTYGVGLVAIHRGERQPPFRLTDQLILSQWASHLARLMMVRGRMAADRRRAERSTARLDALGLSVMQLRGDGRIEHANAAAERMLKQGRGLVARGGFLACPDSANATRLAALIAAAASAPANSDNCLLIPVGGDGQVYRLSLSPLRLDGRNDVLVLIEDGDPEGASSSKRLEGLLGLTRAEAQLAASLCQGLSIETIAERRGVSRNTARSQVQRILEKAGVSRQAELVALLGNIPRALAARLGALIMGFQMVVPDSVIELCATFS